MFIDPPVMSTPPSWVSKFLTPMAALGPDRDKLMQACERGLSSRIKPLMDCGSDVNATNSIGTTGLMMAAYYGRTFVIQALLAVPGIKQNAANDNGHNACMMAILGTLNNETLQALLDSPDVNTSARDLEGNTAYDLLAKVSATRKVNAALAQIAADTSEIAARSSAHPL